MFFDVTADAYGRFMGRYAEPLADQFAAYAGVGPGDRVLDVGCGPGALTARLVDADGVERVTAIDPSPPFVAATARRFPGIDVREGAAEALPFADDDFDAALAQLVVHFMTDPVQGLREMARVTRPGGTVAACVWDHGGGRARCRRSGGACARSTRQRSARASLAGCARGPPGRARRPRPGSAEVEQTVLTVAVPYPTFDEWWEPYTFGVGPAGRYVAGLPAEQRDRVRDACAAHLPAAPFEITASAWTVRALV